MTKKFWRIIGHMGYEKIFEAYIPQGLLTDRKLRELLTCLAAKQGLSYNEIVGVYVKRNTKLAHGKLEVQKNEIDSEYSCGNQPDFAAVLVDEHRKRIKRKPL